MSIEAGRMVHQVGSAKYQCITPNPAVVRVEDSAANPEKLPWSKMRVSTRIDTEPSSGGPRCHHREVNPSSGRRQEEGIYNDLTSFNGIGDWRKCELLGRGAHGVVYRGVLAATGESVAVKQTHTKGISRSELQVSNDWVNSQRT